jgi:ppGpp synthetase/RelA/SpoT-type nucleotidyltranferase
VIIRRARRALAEQRLLLRGYLEDVGARNVHYVRGRVKSLESVQRLIQRRRYRWISEIPDLAGMRVVVHGRPDVDVILRFFERQQQRGDLKIVSNRAVEHRGYRARHLVLEVPGSYRRANFSIKMEVQVRTLCEDLFDALSRAYWYKCAEAEPPKSLREKLLAHTEAAEDIVTGVREQVEAALAKQDEDRVTPFSFRSIVAEELSETVCMEDAVEQVIRLCDRARYTNRALRALFRSNEAVAKVAEIESFEDSHGDPARTFRSLGRRWDLFLIVDWVSDLEQFKQELLKSWPARRTPGDKGT